jgi:hypothetical protein
MMDNDRNNDYVILRTRCVRLEVLVLACISFCDRLMASTMNTNEC